LIGPPRWCLVVPKALRGTLGEDAMTSMIRTTVAAALAGLATAACANMSGSDDGWVDLLAGGLDGMVQAGGADWTFEGGEVKSSSGTAAGFLLTPDDYADFELTVEFYVSTEHNGGVFFRCEDRASILDTTCYEANIFDARPDQSGRTGAIVNLAPPLVKIDAADKWSTYVIRVEGDHIVITLDGQTTVDVRDSRHAAPGPIGLQRGAGEVIYRNARVRRL
jgi:hypothetical protein